MGMKLKGVFVFGVMATVLGAQVCVADATKGKGTYDARCASCHGPAGAGDGPVAASLPPESKPRNLAEGKFKFSTDDAKMKMVIKDGGVPHGLNPLMPPHSDLSDEDISNVIEYVKSLKK